MPELSVIIPARDEPFLHLTVADVLAASRLDTEVIVVVDGTWPLEPLAQHPRLNVIRVPRPIGQRAACNLGARLSGAPYIMKLDAHCAVAPGFDAELVASAASLGAQAVQVPRQYNLHVFDWRCEACGRRTFQGPTRTRCGVPANITPEAQADELRLCGAGCGAAGPFERVIVWNWNRRLTEAWRFNAALEFQYAGELKDRQDKAAKAAGQAAPEFLETMSCLGACWFLSREQFWRLGGLDEKHGGWGQMGVELACKAWLSGGRLLTNRRTWFSHLFRTQGGDFGFPYPLSGADRDRAREYSRHLWLNNKWAGQTRPLRWLVEHFAPVHGWTPEQIKALPEALERQAVTV